MSDYLDLSSSGLALDVDDNGTTRVFADYRATLLSDEGKVRIAQFLLAHQTGAFALLAADIDFLVTLILEKTPVEYMLSPGNITALGTYITDHTAP